MKLTFLALNIEAVKYAFFFFFKFIYFFSLVVFVVISHSSSRGIALQLGGQDAALRAHFP